MRTLIILCLLLLPLAAQAGEALRAVTLIDGTVLQGCLVERGPNHVVLDVLGGAQRELLAGQIRGIELVELPPGEASPCGAVRNLGVALESRRRPPSPRLLAARRGLAVSIAATVPLMATGAPLMILGTTWNYLPMDALGLSMVGLSVLTAGGGAWDAISAVGEVSAWTRRTFEVGLVLAGAGAGGMGAAALIQGALGDESSPWPLLVTFASLGCLVTGNVVLATSAGLARKEIEAREFAAKPRPMPWLAVADRQVQAGIGFAW